MCPSRCGFIGFLLLGISAPVNAQDGPSLAQVKSDATQRVEEMRDFTQQTLDMIFSFGELGFQEIETSAYITEIRGGTGNLRDAHGMDGDMGLRGAGDRPG